MGFVSTSYIKYNNEQASYYRCIDRQTHLAEQYIFNENLIIALSTTEALDEETIEEIRSALISPQGLNVCVEASYF